MPVELPEVVVTGGLADQLGIEDIGKPPPPAGPSLAEQAGIGDIRTDIIDQYGFRDTGNGTLVGTQTRSFARMAKPPYLTRAVVLINGVLYYEWTAVWVKFEVGPRNMRTFRLTCSESGPWDQDWAYLRIRPGDTCTVYLDGYLALKNGKVIIRQVYYDGAQHQIQIQGEDATTYATKGAAVSDSGEFKNKTLKQFADEIAAKYGIKVIAGAGVPEITFPRISVSHTESVWEAIEKEARQVGVWLGVTRNGELALVAPQGALAETDAALIEGYNIISARETIENKTPNKNMATGQGPGNDQNSGAEVAHQRHQEGKGGGADFLGPSFMPSTVLSEIPAWGNNFLDLRRRMETNVEDWFHTEVQITHLGWQRPNNGGLWEVWDRVWVDSPMLIMKRTLLLKEAVFTQDRQGGTKTMLTLVNMISNKAPS